MVSEHLDTKSIVELMSRSDYHDTVIAAKSRPFGKSNNRRVMGWIPSLVLCKSKDAVSLGEVNGVFHHSLSRLRLPKFNPNPRKGGRNK